MTAGPAPPILTRLLPMNCSARPCCIPPAPPDAPRALSGPCLSKTLAIRQSGLQACSAQRFDLARKTRQVIWKGTSFSDADPWDRSKQGHKAKNRAVGFTFMSRGVHIPVLTMMHWLPASGEKAAIQPTKSVLRTKWLRWFAARQFPLLYSPIPEVHPWCARQGLVCGRKDCSVFAQIAQPAGAF